MASCTDVCDESSQSSRGNARKQKLTMTIASMAMRQVLQTLLAILLICAVHAAPLTRSPPIKSIAGQKEFDKAVGTDKFSFAKFFHPDCPHCQAMAKDFDELSYKIAEHNRDPGTPQNHTIEVIQVDASKEENHPVMEMYAAAFPTLKLFRSGKVVLEYFGPREAEPMYKFLMRSLKVADRPLVTHLHNSKQVEDFLKLASDRPIVISLFQPRLGSPVETDTIATDHFPAHIHLSFTEWDETVNKMHEHTSPQTVFATVPQPAMLVPSSLQERFDQIKSRHFVAPLLAAAPRASDFNTSAEWYFPGVRDGASPSSFMHTAIVGGKQYVTLSQHNSPHVLETTRPLAIAFGKRDGPGYYAEDFLLKAAVEQSIPKMLPVYASMKYSRDLAEHVGLNVSDLYTSEANIAKWETKYVLYRFGNRGPVSHIYSESDGKTLGDWLSQQAKTLNESEVRITAGEVVELDSSSWRNLFEFDGRGVVLELYTSNCSSCSDLSRTTASVAAQLRPYSESIVVARFNTGKYETPSWPVMPNDTRVPEILWVAPGESSTVYGWFRSSRGVARFAMEMSGLKGDSVDWADVVLTYMLACGVCMFFVGVGLMYRARRRKWKREHVT